MPAKKNAAKVAKPAPARKGKRKWWYGVASAAIICLFFLAIDFMTSGGITWSIWPIGAVIFFSIAFQLLDKVARE